MQIRLFRRAINRFFEIFDYLNLLDPQFAIKFAKNIDRKIKMLIKFPFIGRAIPDFEKHFILFHLLKILFK
jgi:plasmid stabilization system protein ParE